MKRKYKNYVLEAKVEGGELWYSVISPRGGEIASGYASAEEDLKKFMTTLQSHADEDIKSKDTCPEHGSMVNSTGLYYECGCPR